MSDLILTGGLGFVGKNYYKYFKHLWSRIIIYDKKTYASDLKFISSIKRKKDKIIIGDICNYKKYIKYIKPSTTIIHFAAESHVDRSFKSSIKFTKSNTLGTHILLEACRECKPKKIIIISTDEVYGETINCEKNEKSLLEPTNPYSGSKAGADLLTQTYIKSFNMPIILIRSNNIYGPRQNSEKILPGILKSLYSKKKVHIHGRGNTIRHFLHVYDFCKALNLIIKKSKVGEIYNIKGKSKYKIFQLLELFSKISRKKNFYKFVKDRPFNDKIYSISCKKLHKLGWKEEKKFLIEIKKLYLAKSFI